MIRRGQFVIIIGSAKCGTTSLFDYLSQHPQICRSSWRKEPEYFSEHQYVSPAIRKRIRRYEDFWPDFDPQVHRYALEGSTGYTKWPQESGVAERMRVYGIQPRLIYVVRDPIERIESEVNYRQIRSRKPVSFDSESLIDISRYAVQLDPFVEAFGRNAIRVIDFARLRNDVNGVCADLYKWLGLEEHIIQQPKISNQTASLQTSRLYRFESLRRAVWFIPQDIREQVKAIATKVAPYKHERVRLTPQHVQSIRESLKEDANRLSREWGVDVDSWGFGAISK